MWDVQLKTALCELRNTFSSQSGLMAKFPGLRSCEMRKEVKKILSFLIEDTEMSVFIFSESHALDFRWHDTRLKEFKRKKVFMLQFSHFQS